MKAGVLLLALWFNLNTIQVLLNYRRMTIYGITDQDEEF